MSDIKFEGLEELKNALKTNVKMEDVKRVVKTNGARLQAQTVRNSGEGTFHKGYFTGNLKRDVSAQGLKIEDGGMTATVGTTVEYGPYLEYGTRFMSKEQFLKPSLDGVEPKFIADMQKLVK